MIGPFCYLDREEVCSEADLQLTGYRAHRMGQQDDVKIYKVSALFALPDDAYTHSLLTQLTIDDTVEDRILTLQADKAQLAKAALDGGSVGNLNKLSVKEILYLFKASADA